MKKGCNSASFIFLFMPKKFFYFSLLIFILPAFLGGCTLPWKKVGQNNQPNNNDSEVVVESKKTDRLKQFSNYSELASFLSSHEAAPASTWNDKAPIENIAGFKDNPVDSIAESDVIKQTGNVIYSLVKEELIVMQADAQGGTTLLGKMKFPFRPLGLFLEDGALVVYGQDENISDSASYKSRQFVRIFDISKPEDPRESRDLAFEGYLGQSFVRGGYLYFLTEKNYYNSKGGATPQVFENGKAISSDCSAGAKCFAPPVFYFDSVYDSYRLLSINAVNLKDSSEALSGQIYVLNGDQKYAVLGDNIYIFHLKSSLAEITRQAKQAAVLKKLDEQNKKIVDEINSAPSYLLSDEEKTSKIAALIDSFIAKMPTEESILLEVEIDDAISSSLKKKGFAAKTIIHKLVPAGLSIDYFASAEVDGLVFGPDSVFDDGEYLYLATKSEKYDNAGDDQKYLSNVVVFDKLLAEVGKLENISTKEEIYGARFIGQRAFLPATKEGTSVFVVSLEDKASPAYIGTLKIPGANNYLRPVDADGNKFLSLSYDIDKEDLAGPDYPIKLSLYDFSNLKQPKELGGFLLGDAGSESVVFNDFKALYYSNKDSVFSIPVSFKVDGRLNFSGALVFSLIGDSLELKGRLDHSAGGFYNQLDRFNGVSYLENTVRRSLFLNGKIYTFSNKFLRYSSLDSFDNPASLELSENPDDLLISSASTDASIITDSSQDADVPLNDNALPESATQPDTGALPGEAMPDNAFDLVPPVENNGLDAAAMP